MMVVAMMMGRFVSIVADTTFDQVIDQTGTESHKLTGSQWVSLCNTRPFQHRLHTLTLQRKLSAMNVLVHSASLVYIHGCILWYHLASTLYKNGTHLSSGQPWYSSHHLKKWTLMVIGRQPATIGREYIFHQATTPTSQYIITESYSIPSHSILIIYTLI